MMVLNPFACKINKYLQIKVSPANFFVFYKTHISLFFGFLVAVGTRFEIFYHFTLKLPPIVHVYGVFQNAGKPPKNMRLCPCVSFFLAE